MAEFSTQTPSNMCSNMSSDITAHITRWSGSENPHTLAVASYVVPRDDRGRVA